MHKMKLSEDIWDYILDILFPKTDLQIFLESINGQELVEKVGAPDDNIPPYKAPLSYRNPVVRQMIWLLKYRGNKKIAKTLASVLSESILEDISDNLYFTGSKKFILIPAPLSKKKISERGFNQAELLCHELEKIHSDIFETNSTILQKIKDTPSQSKTNSKKERLQNLSGAFFSNTKLEGKNIIVIDDVFTTGTTFLEIGKVLKRQKTRQILFYAVAH